MKWFKWVILLGAVVFAVYLNQLHTVVKEEFSKPLASIDSHLDLKEYPVELINMLLIVEDQSFFKHSGVDFVEIGRVARDYWLYDKPIRGASTITQQLIKSSLLTREKTFERKFKEGLMAFLLEVSFDKQTILTRYMNSVYLGQKGNYEVRGFERAAQFYFNQDVRALPLERLSALVALLKGPSYYNPIKRPQRLLQRQKLVLHLYHTNQKIVK
ncbi:transglycosylase domain-containing protein [Candidatus Thiodubiliella endoseptemdiera]|uniref:transglycosylase domain-containing protein n=1 Tax=Candidatus Thiodubiliella endoseptemdiera TaxID=2738886 RepID=UPI0034DDE6EF